jgi:KDO2-lipid IV(A) lauroyltransferase
MKVILLKTVVWFLALFPARVLAWLSDPLGALAWRFSNTRRSTTERNLAACFPDLTNLERERLGRDSMRHFVMIGLEAGMGWAWSQKRLERHFVEHDGFEYMLAALKEGRGVLALVPHFGNWELINHWTQFRVPLLALYKPSGSHAVQEAVVRNRTRFGALMAPTTGAGLKQLYGHVREGYLVAVLPDQDPGKGNGRFAPFFGVPALTGVLSVRLIQKTGCRVVYAACRRVGRGRYQACFRPADPEIYSADVDQALAALNRGVEEIVALDKAQYLWAYKRFKSRPEGEPRFY